jgi:hypothetical protein
LALYGILSVATTSSKDSPPPIIADLVPGHNQIVEFDSSSGSSSIDIDKVFAKQLLGEAFANRELFEWKGRTAKLPYLRSSWRRI